MSQDADLDTRLGVRYRNIRNMVIRLRIAGMPSDMALREEIRGFVSELEAQRRSYMDEWLTKNTSESNAR